MLRHLEERRQWRLRNENPFLENEYGDEGLELTDEDERILDKVWREHAEGEPQPKTCDAMSDEETLELFGLAEKVEE